MKTQVLSFILTALFAVQPAAAMMNSKAMLAGDRERDILEYEEKWWASCLGHELPALLMPHLGNSNLVDLVGMSASKYYRRKIKEAQSSAPQEE